jgi:hypothetical protein
MPQRKRVTLQEYARQLAQHPESGSVAIVRVTNKRSVQLHFLMEPLGDQAEPIQPGEAYDIVAQAPKGDYLLDVDIEDDCLRVWFISSTGTFGKVFKEGVSATG